MGGLGSIRCFAGGAKGLGHVRRARKGRCRMRIASLALRYAPVRGLSGLGARESYFEWAAHLPFIHWSLGNHSPVLHAFKCCVTIYSWVSVPIVAFECFKRIELLLQIPKTDGSGFVWCFARQVQFRGSRREARPVETGRGSDRLALRPTAGFASLAPQARATGM